MREHVLFDSPHAIDVHATVEVPTPKPWQAALPDQATVAALRVADTEVGMSGWCTAIGELQGPEIEVMCGGINDKQPTHAGIWRQGHLLHFGFEPSPSQCNATGRMLLLNSIAYIARFATDRPVMRLRTFVDPTGSDAPAWRADYLLQAKAVTEKQLAAAFAEPWHSQLAALELEAGRAFVRERLPALRCNGNKLAFDEDAMALGVDLRRDGVLAQLAAMLDGEQAAAARTLLQRLLPDGPGPDTTPANWSSWLQARADALCFDPHSHVWRLDALAQRRGVASASLRGPDRADGDATRDPAAAALAAKVVARYGGARALDDLQSFTVRQGDLRYLWDRREGVFRMEHHGGPTPGNRATPWQVVVFDTAADADLLLGGGPPPRPTVSGRSAFRELVARLFLPLLLLEPGTSLRRLPDDDAGRHQLEVRLAGRAMDARQLHVLHIAPATGEIAAVDVMAEEGTSATTWEIDAVLQVGPLTLPSRFRRGGRAPLDVEFAAAAWNPPVPAGAASQPARLLGEK